MSALAEAPRDSAEPLAVPGFWSCPKCVYRIPVDFPGGTREPIAAHENGHRLKEMGITPKVSYGLLRPGTPRR